jgi:hypothetical protein
LRALAVSNAAALEALSGRADDCESGLPGFEARSWYGFVVAARTPQAIVARLNRDLVQILERPEVSDALLSWDWKSGRARPKRSAPTSSRNTTSGGRSSARWESPQTEGRASPRSPTRITHDA